MVLHDNPLILDGWKGDDIFRLPVYGCPDKHEDSRGVKMASAKMILPHLPFLALIAVYFTKHKPGPPVIRFIFFCDNGHIEFF